MKTIREKIAKRPVFAVSLLIASALVSACGKSASTTSPTSTTTPADSLTETFTGTLLVGGSAFYSISLATAGTVTATLTDIGGNEVPPSVMVNLGIGTLSQFKCSATPTQVQVVERPGCRHRSALPSSLVCFAC